MTTQTELATGLTDLTATVVAIGTGVTALVQKVKDLETALANAGTLTPEVVSAFDALKGQVDSVAVSIPTV